MLVGPMWPVQNLTGHSSFQFGSKQVNWFVHKVRYLNIFNFQASHIRTLENLLKTSQETDNWKKILCNDLKLRITKGTNNFFNNLVNFTICWKGERNIANILLHTFWEVKFHEQALISSSWERSTHYRESDIPRQRFDGSESILTKFCIN